MDPITPRREAPPARVLVVAMDLCGKSLEDVRAAAGKAWGDAIALGLFGYRPEGYGWPEDVCDGYIIGSVFGGAPGVPDTFYRCDFSWNGEVVTLDPMTVAEVREKPREWELVKPASLSLADKPRRLFSARVTLADAPSEGGRSTSWVQVLPAPGSEVFTNNYPEPITVTTALCEGLVKRFGDLLALGVSFPADYNHGSMPTDTPAAPEATIKAGDILALEARADGLWAQVDWTARAVEFIRAGEYDLISPELWRSFRHPESGDEIGPVLRAIALVSRPALPGMERVTASERTPNRQESKMDEHEVKALREQIAGSAAEIQTLQEKVKASEADAAAHKAEVVTLREQVAAKDGEVKRLSDSLAGLTAEREAAADEALIKVYEEKRKIVPATRESDREIVRQMGREFAQKHFDARPEAYREGAAGISGAGGKVVVGAGNVSCMAEAITEARVSIAAKRGCKPEAVPYQEAIEAARAAHPGMEQAEYGAKD